MCLNKKSKAMFYNILLILSGLNLYFQLAESACQSSEWRCPNGLCIPKAWVCDYEPDCSDGADEKNCSRCESTGYVCKTGGKCIANQWKCDGWVDCPDASDECNCPDTTIACPTSDAAEETGEPLVWKECKNLQEITWLGFILSTDTSKDPKAQVYWLEPYTRDKTHVELTSENKPGDLFSIGRHTITYVAKASNSESIFCNIPLLVLGNMQSSQLQVCHDLAKEESTFISLIVDSDTYTITDYTLPDSVFDIDRYYTPTTGGSCYAKIAMQEKSSESSNASTGEWMVEQKWPIALLVGCFLGLCIICIGSIVYWDKKNYERLQSDRENSAESSASCSESEEQEEDEEIRDKNKHRASVPQQGMSQSLPPSNIYPSRIPHDRRSVSMEMYAMETAPTTKPMPYLVTPNSHSISIPSPGPISAPPGHNRSLPIPIHGTSNIPPPNVISAPVRHPSFSVTPSQIYQPNDANMADFRQLSQLQAQFQLQQQQQQQHPYIHSHSHSRSYSHSQIQPQPQPQPQQQQQPQPQPLIQTQPQTQPQIQPQIQPQMQPQSQSSQSQVAITRNDNYDYNSLQAPQSRSSTRRQTVCGVDVEDLVQQSHKNNRTPKGKESSRKKMEWLQTPGRETDAVKEMLEQDSQEDSIGSGSRPPSEML